MAIVRKFTIGVLPFAKSFRMRGLGGVATDNVLRLRGKSLSDNFFTDVGTGAERNSYRLSSEDDTNVLQLTQESITFTKEYYGSTTSFDFKKVLEEFRLIWGAVDGVLKTFDIRRIGIVSELQYAVPDGTPSAWLRSKLTTIPTNAGTDKFSLRYEEREYAKDGRLPDPKKADFLNSIYSIYDSALDADRPLAGFVNVTVDVQRYFTPLHNGNVGDEVLKLKQHLEASQQRIDGFLLKAGATHAKK
jgi:hypothetical protein